MKEKKQFFIPKNYEKKFEWIPGISGWQHVAFIPIVGLDFLIIQHTPFDFSNKVIFIAVSFAIPWVLMGTHPVRDNVPLYKHLLWKLKFLSRQRQFHYKKEGYEYVLQQNEEIKPGTSEPKTTRSSKKINTRLNPGKRDSARITYNSRQQNDPVSKSVSN